MISTDITMISFDDFSKLELKIGTVLEAEEVEGSEKLIKLKVDLGPAPDGAGQDIRQILAGVKQWYSPEDLIGKQLVMVANLEPKMMMGLESQGMVLAADSEAGPVFLTVSKEILPGAKIR